MELIPNKNLGHLNMPRYRQIELTPKMAPQTQLTNYMIFLQLSFYH
jgi:hypothetical protein